MPMYIHEHKEWPSFSWNKELVGEKLNKANKAVGYLMGRLSVIGFNDKMSAVVESISHDIIASSEIEGVELNNEQVRSSVARKLGVQLTLRLAQLPVSYRMERSNENRCSPIPQWRYESYFWNVRSGKGTLCSA